MRQMRQEQQRRQERGTKRLADPLLLSIDTPLINASRLWQPPKFSVNSSDLDGAMCKSAVGDEQQEGEEPPQRPKHDFEYLSPVVEEVKNLKGALKDLAKEGKDGLKDLALEGLRVVDPSKYQLKKKSFDLAEQLQKWRDKLSRAIATVKRRCVLLVKHPWFGGLTLVLIFASTGVLAMESEDLEADKASGDEGAETLSSTIKGLNTAFAICFTIEMAIKITALTFKGYLADSWNDLDAFIVIVSWITLFDVTVAGLEPATTHPQSPTITAQSPHYHFHYHPSITPQSPTPQSRPPTPPRRH